MSGRHISIVQERSLELVMVLEALAENRRSAEEFKRVIVSSDPVKFLPLMYPEMGRTQVEEIDEKELMEDSAGQWLFEEKVDPAEAERLMQDMLRQGSGSMDMKDIEQFSPKG